MLSVDASSSKLRKGYLMTSGCKPPTAFCPVVEGFCAVLTCSDCNHLYDYYEDIAIEWVCLKCSKEGKVLPFTDYTACDVCGTQSLCGARAALAT